MLCFKALMQNSAVTMQERFPSGVSAMKVTLVQVEQTSEAHLQSVSEAVPSHNLSLEDPGLLPEMALGANPAVHQLTFDDCKHKTQRKHRP